MRRRFIEVLRRWVARFRTEMVKASEIDSKVTELRSEAWGKAIQMRGLF